MSDKLRLIGLIAIVFLAVLAFLGWRTAVFCYSLDFPENFELVVSRCHDAQIMDVSPNGENIVVWIEIPKREYWLINNITNEHFTLPPTSLGYTFVTDGQMLFGLDEAFYLWDISLQQAQLLETLDINPDEQDGVERLAAMDKIYYLERPNLAITFALDSNDQSRTKYLIIDSQQPGNIFREIEDFLVENEFDYELVLSAHRDCRPYPPPLDGCVSHNDMFIARNRVIYTRGGDKIFDLQGSGFPDSPNTTLGTWAGWTHDDSGLFFEFGHGYILDNNGGWLIPDIGNIPGGVGILKLPEQ